MMIIAGCLTVIGSMINLNKKSNTDILLTVRGVVLAFGIVFFE